VQLGCAFGQRILHLGDGGQHLVVDGDELHRVVGLLLRLGDDHRDRVPAKRARSVARTVIEPGTIPEGCGGK